MIKKVRGFLKEGIAHKRHNTIIQAKYHRRQLTATYLFISRFGFKSGICPLIAPVPVHCFSITFISKTAQNRFRDVQDPLLSEKADILSFADIRYMKKFKNALEIVDNLKSSEITQLINADGSALLADKSSISERLAEHFSSALNRP